MRKVTFAGYVIFDEEECNHGKNMVGQIEHELFNVDGAVEWEIEEYSNEEIEYDEEE